MVKKSSLAAALRDASKKPTPPVVSHPEHSVVPVQATRPSRIGKKPITGFFDPAVSRQLKQMALDQDSTLQDLLREALNDLFEKHHLKPIA